MDQFLVVLQSLAPHSWRGWSIVLLSGFSVSVLLQLIKHFGKMKEAKKFVTFLLGVLSFIASYADTILAYTNQHSDLLQAANMGWILTAAVFIHRFVVSPVYHKLVNFLDGIYTDAITYRSEQAALKSQTVDMAAAEQTAAAEFTLPSQMA